MFRLNLSTRTVILAAASIAGALAALPAAAQSPSAAREKVYSDVRAATGGVPAFLKQVPDSALASLWAGERDLELSDKTALDAKTKALIGLAVSAQIPCTYCVWSDTRSAKAAGATDQEIGEAVAMAALTRSWSTMFNGLQVDFAQYKKDMGGN